MHFRIMSETLQVTAFQVVLKMNLDSLLSFPAAIVHLSLLNLLILSRALGLDFVLRPPKIPFTIYHKPSTIIHQPTQTITSLN